MHGVNCSPRQLRSSNAPRLIWCSKEPKAVETAEIIADAFGVPNTDRRWSSRSIIVATYASFQRTGEFEEAIERFFREPDQACARDRDGSAGAQQVFWRDRRGEQSGSSRIAS